MTWPNVFVAAGYSLSATDALPAIGAAGWTTLSNVESIRVQTPRRDKWADKFQPGRMTVVADNSTRQLDPFASGSGLRPRLPMRAYVDAGSLGLGGRALFTGYLDSAEPIREYPDNSTTVLMSTDGMRLLTRQGFSDTVFPAQGTAARISALLDAADWASSDRDIGAGASILAATTIATEARAWAELDRVRDHEHGVLHFDPMGAVKFRGRVWPYTSTVWTFTDTGAGYEFVSAAESMDEDRLLNSATMALASNPTTTVHAHDSTSMALYGKVETVQTDWQYEALSELADWPAIVVSIGKGATKRLTSLTLDPTHDDALWTPILTAEVGQRVSVTVTPPGGGSAIVRTGFIDGMAHDVRQVGSTAGTWRTVWQLSDATDWPTWTPALYDTAAYDSDAYFY